MELQEEDLLELKDKSLLGRQEEGHLVGDALEGLLEADRMGRQE